MGEKLVDIFAKKIVLIGGSCVKERYFGIKGTLSNKTGSF
jgi:hypothetical protein